MGYSFPSVVRVIVMWLVRLLIARRAALGARPEALDRRALVDEGAADLAARRDRARSCSPRWRRPTRAASRCRRRRRAGCAAGSRGRPPTSLPRMWSITSRALRGAVRTYLACARTATAPDVVARAPRQRACLRGALGGAAVLGGLRSAALGLPRPRASVLGGVVVLERVISSAFLPLLGSSRFSSSALSSSTVSSAYSVFSAISASSPCRCRRGRGTCAWARTRPACGRPSTRR